MSQIDPKLFQEWQNNAITRQVLQELKEMVVVPSWLSLSELKGEGACFLLACWETKDRIIRFLTRTQAETEAPEAVADYYAYDFLKQQFGEANAKKMMEKLKHDMEGA